MTYPLVDRAAFKGFQKYELFFNYTNIFLILYIIFQNFINNFLKTTNNIFMSNIILPKIKTPAGKLTLVMLDPIEVSSIHEYYKSNNDFFGKFIPVSQLLVKSSESALNFLIAEEQLILQNKALRLYIIDHKEVINNEKSFKSNRCESDRRVKPIKIMGDVSIANIAFDDFMSCNIGYKLDTESTGKGIMASVLGSFIDYIFNRIGLHRIEADIAVHNEKSIALAEKLGFHREGVLQQYIKLNDQWTDHYKYALLSKASI